MIDHLNLNFVETKLGTRTLSDVDGLVGTIYAKKKRTLGPDGQWLF